LPKGTRGKVRRSIKKAADVEMKPNKSLSKGVWISQENVKRRLTRKFWVGSRASRLVQILAGEDMVWFKKRKSSRGKRGG